jgi:hypothetical protein
VLLVLFLLFAMDTLHAQIRAINDIFGAFSTCACSHPVLEKKPDDFMYCYFCGEYVPTMDE